MAVILFMFCYASTSGEGLIVHSTCSYSRVKLSWSLSNCVIHIPLKALASVTYTCISTIYCILGNVPPFYFHPLCPCCHQQIYHSLIPTVSRRIQDGAELFASVEGKIYMGENNPEYSNNVYKLKLFL